MSRKHLALSLLVLALLAVTALPVLAEGGVQVTLTPDREEMAVGDVVPLTLEVTHPAGQQVIVPQLEQGWGPFEVRNQSQATTVANDDGTETTRQTIEVTLFDLGEFETPELPLTLSNGAGSMSEVTALPVSLRVMPTLAEEDNDLRDIKPQASLTVPPAWPWIAGGLLLAGALAALGWWIYRRRQGKPFGLAPAVDNRPAWQVAYDSLVSIEGMGLPAQERFKEHYSLVTDVLRTYLEAQFGLSILERTTSELKSILRQSNLEPEPVRLLLDLFAESDLVKFAKYTPDLDTAGRVVDRARRLVDVTRPQAESDLETFFEGSEPPAQPLATTRLSYQSGQ